MLTVWDPFADLSRIQRQFERSFFAPRGNATNRSGNPVNPPLASFVPAVDVFEDEEGLVLRTELPGVKREDVEIELADNVLTLKGERKLESQPEGRRYHRVERAHGSFVRQFQLPTNVDGTQIEAQLLDGVLTVKLPKKPEQKSRRIEVKSSDGN
jgi:HSP20 family protein